MPHPLSLTPLFPPCRFVLVGRGRADDALLGGDEYLDRLSGGADGDGRAERAHARVVLPRLRGRGTHGSQPNMFLFRRHFITNRFICRAGLEAAAEGPRRAPRPSSSRTTTTEL